MNRQQQLIQRLGIALLGFCLLLVMSFLGIIFFDIIVKGSPALSWEFITGYPVKGMTKGGIFPTIIGTTLVTIVTAVFAVPLGICCAIYLNEYAIENAFNRLIRAAIRNLAGVPSIIYGLFGVALFVESLRLGTSLLSAGFTLGLMSLPYIITTTEEALRNIPKSMREASLALGATKWETIRRIVLPSAIPGIMTGTILGLSRAAGETAPILFTGVVFYMRYLPAGFLDQFMAMPYHLYILSTQHHAIEKVRPLAYATAMILILLLFLLNVTAFIIRYRYRKSLKYG